MCSNPPYMMKRSSANTSRKREQSRCSASF
jgi:tRNA1(Val) A37 N6-methylase TrmN6